MMDQKSVNGAALGGAVTPELVERMAELSRLELGEEEAGRTAAELERVLKYMDVLGRLDAPDAEAMARLFPAGNVLREDEAVPSTDRAELLAGAPCADGEAFLVPRTI